MDQAILSCLIIDRFGHFKKIHKTVRERFRGGGGKLIPLRHTASVFDFETLQHLKSPQKMYRGLVHKWVQRRPLGSRGVSAGGIYVLVLSTRILYSK